jgi:hypothetical protein
LVDIAHRHQITKTLRILSIASSHPATAHERNAGSAVGAGTRIRWLRPGQLPLQKPSRQTSQGSFYTGLLQEAAAVDMEWTRIYVRRSGCFGFHALVTAWPVGATSHSQSEDKAAGGQVNADARF